LVNIILITTSLATVTESDPQQQRLTDRGHGLPEGSHYLGKYILNDMMFDNCYSIPDATGSISDQSIIECGNDLGN
jgi:hypothetical protein